MSLILNAHPEVGLLGCTLVLHPRQACGREKPAGFPRSSPSGDSLGLAPSVRLTSRDPGIPNFDTITFQGTCVPAGFPAPAGSLPCGRGREWTWVWVTYMQQKQPPSLLLLHRQLDKGAGAAASAPVEFCVDIKNTDTNSVTCSW